MHRNEDNTANSSQTPSSWVNVSYCDNWPRLYKCSSVSNPFKSGQCFIPGLRVIKSEFVSSSQTPSSRVNVSYVKLLTVNNGDAFVSNPFKSGHCFRLELMVLVKPQWQSLKPLQVGSMFHTYPFLEPCIATVCEAIFPKLWIVKQKLTFVSGFLPISDPQKVPQTLVLHWWTSFADNLRSILGQLTAKDHDTYNLPLPPDDSFCQITIGYHSFAGKSSKKPAATGGAYAPS